MRRIHGSPLTSSVGLTGLTCVAATAMLALAAAPAGASQNVKPDRSVVGHVKHLVVIYEENHSFDNLYGGWGAVGGKPVEGLAQATAGTTQVDQAGAPISCLPQNDANLVTTTSLVTWLDGSKHPGLLAPRCAGTTPRGVAYDSHFTSSAPFSIQDYVNAQDATCAPPTRSGPNGVQKGDPLGLPGGCTRDIVHRFYQEQYQLDGGKQDRYTTGSDAVGLTQGYYDTASLPIYQYLHAPGAPNYVIADHFFQGAFGGSFLNHQYLVAAQAPTWDTSQRPVPVDATGVSTKNSVVDAAGFPNKTYPLYNPLPGVPYNDSVLTQECGKPTTVPGYACGNFAINTMQPSWAPSAGGSNVLPGINDVDASKANYETNIGDELSSKKVPWAWYAGGWDDANAGHADPLFQYHHQPFNYFQNYAPGQPGRAHLKDEKDFFAAAASGELPAVSFVKPIGEENEHPGYASTDNGESHLIELLKAVQAGPDADSTLVVVTYDEFGGQWDHVAPPGQNAPGVTATAGPSDAFGPGTRIPAIVIGAQLRHSAVDSTPYDTTSIVATIERAYGLAPLDGANRRDALVNDLRTALLAGGAHLRSGGHD